MENHDSFMARVAWMSEANQMRIEWAYTSAKYYHRWQERKELAHDGTHVRYFEHLRRAAIILLDELHIGDPDLVIATLLHDSVEDTRLSGRMIEHFLGINVGCLVKMVSKVPKEGFKERLMWHASYDALMIKGVDRLDNLRHIATAGNAFVQKQLIETRMMYYPLMDRLVELADNDPFKLQCAKWIRQTIRDTAEKLDS